MPNAVSENQSIQKITLTREKIDDAKVKKISLTPEKIFSPTLIDFPPNEYETGRPSITLRGRAHPGDRLQLQARDQGPFEATADQSGSFVFDEVRLYNKANTITIFNPTLESRGISNSRISVTVYYDSSHAPYFGRYDPITKVSLNTVDASVIVRCNTCRTFQLKESWISVGNRCTLALNCQDQFWVAQDEEFWQL
jgi:hypothetical protein